MISLLMVFEFRFDFCGWIWMPSVLVFVDRADDEGIHRRLDLGKIGGRHRPLGNQNGLTLRAAERIESDEACAPFRRDFQKRPARQGVYRLGRPDTTSYAPADHDFALSILMPSRRSSSCARGVRRTVLPMRITVIPSGRLRISRSLTRPRSNETGERFCFGCARSYASALDAARLPAPGPASRNTCRPLSMSARALLSPASARMRRANAARSASEATETASSRIWGAPEGRPTPRAASS